MMDTSYTSQDLEQGPAVIRALRSLTETHVQTILDAVHAISAGWELEQHNDYEGYLSILVSPAKPTDNAPFFIISGTVDQIELAELRGDQLNQLGRFSTIGSAATELTKLLAMAASANNDLERVHQNG